MNEQATTKQKDPHTRRLLWTMRFMGPVFIEKIVTSSFELKRFKVKLRPSN